MNTPISPIQKFDILLIALTFILILGCTTNSVKSAETTDSEILERTNYGLPDNETVKVNIENSTFIGQIPKISQPVQVPIQENENPETQNSEISSFRQTEPSEEPIAETGDLNSDEITAVDSNSGNVNSAELNTDSNSGSDPDSSMEQIQAESNNSENESLANSAPTVFGFIDDFSQGLGNWTEVFNGFGRIWIENNELNMKPQTSVSARETHAPLIVSNSVWQNFVLEFDQKTVQQLRQNSSPNTWEVAWIMFRYTKLENYYYFIFKTNGVQLAKKHGSLNEIFLQTPNQPRVQIGQWNHIKIDAQGNHIQIWVDNQLVIDYTDLDPLTSGKIGLYNEDAWTQFDNIQIRPI